jgi:hypothetical protein
MFNQGPRERQGEPGVKIESYMYTWRGITVTSTCGNRLPLADPEAVYADM